MGNLHMLKERKKKQACLTKGSYAVYHTRWHGLQSYRGLTGPQVFQ